MNIRYAMLATILGIIPLAGCGGGDATVTVQATRSITTGQELQDLQRALDEGAITQDEFNTVKKALLRRPE